jgi:Ni2+-binding GTPase involved in maturation of urease and hydrogenase
MSARPIVVRDGEPPEDLRRLMRAGRVRHLPVVEGDRLLGVWTATEEGPLVMLGPEAVHETGPDVEASEAMEALLSDSEVVLVWDAGAPAGVLTRADALGVVRSALAHGIGRRHPRPVVVRLAGPAGAGKTTLLIRTLPLLGRLDVAVVQANAPEPGEPAELGGARAVDDPGAHWRSGLQRAVERLADAQLILVEDRDGPLEASRGIGEDVQVAVVAAAESGEVLPVVLEEAQALVLTRCDEMQAAQVDDLAAGLRERLPGVAVLAVAAGHDDRGLADWARWLEGQVLSRRG